MGGRDHHPQREVVLARQGETRGGPGRQRNVRGTGEGTLGIQGAPCSKRMRKEVTGGKEVTPNDYSKDGRGTVPLK